MNEISDRHQILEDQLLWTSLAFTSCGLLQDSVDNSLRAFWIDDFLAESAIYTQRGVDVHGIAGVGKGSRDMHRYRFVVSIPQKMLDRRLGRSSIQCFHLDERKRTLEVEVAHKNPASQPTVSAENP